MTEKNKQRLVRFGTADLMLTFLVDMHSRFIAVRSQTTF